MLESLEAEKQKSEIYFFGYFEVGMRGCGHRLVRHSDGRNDCTVRKAGPWTPQTIDGQLAPKLKDQPQGLVKVHYKDDWTSVSFWDRSGDSRGNSNSNFIMPGLLKPEQVLDRAREAFPHLFRRFNFEIKLPDASVDGTSPEPS